LSLQRLHFGLPYLNQKNRIYNSPDLDSLQIDLQLITRLKMFTLPLDHSPVENIESVPPSKVVMISDSPACRHPITHSINYPLVDLHHIQIL